VTRDRATRKERESERFQISQKDFGWRNAGAVERRARADLESVRNDTIPGLVPVQGTQLRS